MSIFEEDSASNGKNPPEIWLFTLCIISAWRIRPQLTPEEDFSQKSKCHVKF